MARGRKASQCLHSLVHLLGPHSTALGPAICRACDILGVISLLSPNRITPAVRARDAQNHGRFECELPNATLLPCDILKASRDEILGGLETPVRIEGLDFLSGKRITKEG